MSRPRPTCSPRSSGFALRNRPWISMGCGRRSPLQFQYADEETYDSPADARVGDARPDRVGAGGDAAWELRGRPVLRDDSRLRRADDAGHLEDRGRRSQGRGADPGRAARAAAPGRDGRRCWRTRSPRRLLREAGKGGSASGPGSGSGSGSAKNVSFEVPDEGGMGILFPLVLIATAALFGAYLVDRRRRADGEVRRLWFVLALAGLVLTGAAGRFGGEDQGAAARGDGRSVSDDGLAVTRRMDGAGR